MKKNIKQDLQLVGCIPYSPDGLGFCLPVFGHVSLPGLKAIQFVDEVNDTISHFREAVVDSKDFRLLNSEKIYSTGSQLVFVFIDVNGITSFGHLSEIKDVLRRFEISNPKMIEIIMQIRELTGTQVEKREMRKKFRNKLYDAGDGLSAHSFLEDSVLRTELWSLLQRSASDYEAARRILENRSKIRVKIDCVGKVTINLSALSPNDYSVIGFDDIVTYLQNELDQINKPDYNDEKIYTSEEYSLDDAAVNEAVAETKRAGRQEERVAIIMRILLQDYRLGKSVLTIYQQDRGQFAVQALRAIRSMLITDRPPNLQTEQIANFLISTLYRLCFPMNRGALLYFLAKHLAFDQIIAETIKKTLQSSGALAVTEWGVDIIRALDAGSENRS